MIRHLYFHIPFCPKLCPYCCFYVETDQKNKSREFLDALLLEVARQGERYSLRPETIYFGGGTPSMLSVAQLEYLLGKLRSSLDLSALREWTFEINPATVSREKARVLRDFGVTRISVGAQSWDDTVLETLGRAHSSAQTERTFSILREEGFDNLNIDLIFGVPGQSSASWRATQEKTVALQPEHISAYCLTYEEDTAFFRRLKNQEFFQDTDLDADMFEASIDAFSNAGYAHYEISNYALPGRESLHNFAYWNGADYLGFGPSAFSTVGEKRWQNIPNSTAYMQRLGAGESAVSFEEPLDPKTRHGERAAFGLRTNRGLARAELATWENEIREFESLGLLQATGDRVFLTRKGKLLADRVAEIFV